MWFPVKNKELVKLLSQIHKLYACTKHPKTYGIFCSFHFRQMSYFSVGNPFVLFIKQPHKTLKVLIQRGSLVSSPWVINYSNITKAGTATFSICQRFFRLRQLTCRMLKSLGSYSYFILDCNLVTFRGISFLFTKDLYFMITLCIIWLSLTAIRFLRYLTVGWWKICGKLWLSFKLIFKNILWSEYLLNVQSPKNSNFSIFGIFSIKFKMSIVLQKMIHIKQFL